MLRRKQVFNVKIQWRLKMFCHNIVSADCQHLKSKTSPSFISFHQGWSCTLINQSLCDVTNITVISNPPPLPPTLWPPPCFDTWNMEGPTKSQCYCKRFKDRGFFLTSEHKQRAKYAGFWLSIDRCRTLWYLWKTAAGVSDDKHHMSCWLM